MATVQEAESALIDAAAALGKGVAESIGSATWEQTEMAGRALKDAAEALSWLAYPAQPH